MKLVKTSYSQNDVVVLLKDLTGKMKPLNAEEREKKIQSGVHYRAMLPEEYRPDEAYMQLYTKALNEKKSVIAECIAKVAEEMYKNTVNGLAPVIISLARAGIPVGILIKRYLDKRYSINCAHYAISIIRDIGIDENAMEYIYDTEVGKNNNKVDNFMFVDGWIGKGAITEQLKESVESLKETSKKWDKLKDDLYVLSDCANVTKYTGTREDFLLPTACLNSTVSGLTSRTILNEFVDVEQGEYHGAVYFEQFENIDKSKEFIDIITEQFKDIKEVGKCDELGNEKGIDVVKRVCEKFDITDYKKVKPGIGETTRVLLRRVPWAVIVNTSTDMNDSDIAHIILLCKKKNVQILRYDLGNYKVCGVIKELSADA